MTEFVYPQLLQDHELLTRWRRDIHAHPELGFDEHRTASFVADQLSQVGIDVFTGIGRTGVVGRLSRGGDDGRSVGLRADMDALPIQEMNEFAHKSTVDGIFHGCGHDGHTTMLLGAARYLATNGQFSGCVYFIFQPAEEGLGGGDAMIRDGLFRRWSIDEVYGMHNTPGLPIGSFAMRSGPFLAALECFDISITGVGGHAALPSKCVDPIVVGAQLVQALQSVVSRSIDATQSAVVSVTKIRAGDAYNVIPDKLSIGGSIRYLEPGVGDLVRTKMYQLVESIADGNGATAELRFQREGYPPLINHQSCIERAARAATSLVGKENVALGIDPVMGSDDFSFMAMVKPAAYVCIGNGEGEFGGCEVHNPHYDFNDEIIPLGASYWVRLVEHLLPQKSGH